MTDSPAATPAAVPAAIPAGIPAGWYADTRTPGAMRWWDGAAWTEHTAPAAAGAGPVAPAARQLLPLDRPVYSPFIWVMVFLPLMTYTALFLWNPDLRFLSSTGYVSGQIDPLSLYTPSYFVFLGISWVVYGLSVFFAYRDWVWLGRQGVVRRFHWAFAFLSALVYVIGRTVMVRRVAAPRGMAPIWALIGVILIGLIVGISWSVTLMSEIINQVRPAIGG